MPPELPLGLIRNTLEHISRSGDLCAVSLSFHALRAEGQSILFKQRTPSSIDNHSQFMDAVIASPERLALFVRAYFQWLSIYSLSPWQSSAREISQSLYQLLRKTQSALPLMRNLKAFYYRRPIREQPTVFPLRNCWDFALETLNWNASAHDEELYRCFIPTQPELRHISITGPENGTIDGLDPLPLACPKLMSLCGHDRDVYILLPGKTITHLMWRDDRNDNFNDPWTFCNQTLAELAPEFDSIQYFVKFHSVTRRDAVLSYMLKLTHLEIFVDCQICSFKIPPNSQNTDI
ncbi:hypothetical protein D9619_013256 [Psilocybe cf. subviscida]|uniref:Uncharacterized protein n=1 Tax=Psilocybe cf. subviscida TaxID=2480587 RepID=A0A8H5F988_9AGAR|nr:hypothetical protein D9619_013256 [Psilocybe cf. subviscida]